MQPLVVGADTILLPTGMNMGTRALRLKKTEGKYTAEELWTSRQLKPDFAEAYHNRGVARQALGDKAGADADFAQAAALAPAVTTTP